MYKLKGIIPGLPEREARTFTDDLIRTIIYKVTPWHSLGSYLDRQTWPAFKCFKFLLDIARNNTERFQARHMFAVRLYHQFHVNIAEAYSAEVVRNAQG